MRKTGKFKIRPDDIKSEVAKLSDQLKIIETVTESGSRSRVLKKEKSTAANLLPTTALKAMLTSCGNHRV